MSIERKRIGPVAKEKEEEESSSLAASTSTSSSSSSSSTSSVNDPVKKLKQLNEHFSVKSLGYVVDNKLEDIQKFYAREVQKPEPKALWETYKSKIDSEVHQPVLRKALIEKIEEMKVGDYYKKPKAKQVRDIKLGKEKVNKLLECCLYLSYFSLEAAKKFKKIDIEFMRQNKPKQLSNIIKIAAGFLLTLIGVSTQKYQFKHEADIPLLFWVYYVSEGFLKCCEDGEIKDKLLMLKATAFLQIGFIYVNSDSERNNDIKDWLLLNLPEISALVSAKKSLFRFMGDISPDEESDSIWQSFRTLFFLIEMESIEENDWMREKKIITKFISENRMDAVVKNSTSKEVFWGTGVAFNLFMPALEQVFKNTMNDIAFFVSMFTHPVTKHFFKNAIIYMNHAAELEANREGISLSNPDDLLFLRETHPVIAHQLLAMKGMALCWELFCGPRIDNKTAERIVRNEAPVAEKNSLLSTVVQSIYWFLSPSKWLAYVGSFVWSESREATNEATKTLSHLVENSKTFQELDHRISSMTVPDEEKTTLTDIPKLVFPVNPMQYSPGVEPTPYKGNKRFQKALKELNNFTKPAKAKNTLQENKNFIHQGVTFRNVHNAELVNECYVGVSEVVKEEIIEELKNKGNDKLESSGMTWAVGGQGIKRLAPQERDKVAEQVKGNYQYKIKFLGKGGKTRKAGNTRVLGRVINIEGHTDKVIVYYDQIADDELNIEKRTKKEKNKFLTTESLSSDDILLPSSSSSTSFSVSSSSVVSTSKRHFMLEEDRPKSSVGESSDNVQLVYEKTSKGEKHVEYRT